MGRRSDTRQRMVANAALVLRERGVRGTSFPEVLRRASAPRGSIAHHFPGGKSEMLVEAVRWAGSAATRSIRAAEPTAREPAEVVAALVRFYRSALESSDYVAGCPVGAVAQEAYDDPELRAAVADVLGEWRDELSAVLARAGASDEDAVAVTDLCVAAIEGAIMICRVDRSVAALDRVEAQLTQVLRSATGTPSG